MESKRILLGLTVFAGVASSLQAQSEFWTKQAPSPSHGTIMGVAPLSADEIWCSSAPWPFSVNGHIAHTTTGGIGWNVDELDAGGVTAVFFLDALNGWTAGGAFRHTTDGGQTWVTDNTWGSIADLFFLDTQHGWAGGNGGVAYYTVNGGLDWTAVTTPAGNNLGSIWFTDLVNGWAVGGGRIIRSVDGGQSWTLNHDGGGYLSTIQFVSALRGWAIGGDTFMATIDGGQNWFQVPVPAGTWVHSARFFDAQHGVAVGQGGQIVRTADGGLNWTIVRPEGSGPLLRDVEYGDDAQTIVTSGGAGVLLRSTDGGLTWSSIQSGAWGITRDLEVHSATLAWATNQGGEIVRTTNGRFWERVTVPALVGGDARGVEFVDASVGWLVGEYGTASRIAHSSDGGFTWELQAEVGATLFHGVAAFDTQTAVAYGTNVSRTTDGGQTWAPAGPPSGSYNGGAVVGSTAWIAGTHIYKTTDAGATWVQQYQASGPLLADISFANAQYGWASGYGNQILRTTDGGQTWVTQSSGAPAGTGLMGIWAISPTTAWVTGWNGFAARTTDGGTTWVPETLPGAPDAAFESVVFLDAERGWVVGDHGIFSRDPGGDCETISNYCVALANASGQPALIDWGGSCVAALNNFTLTASPIPGQGFLFFFGPTQALVPFGNGIRCVGGGLTRVNPAGQPSGGVATRWIDLTAFGLTAGTTVNFQCWYRDPLPASTMFNVSDALNVTFQ